MQGWQPRWRSCDSDTTGERRRLRSVPRQAHLDVHVQHLIQIFRLLLLTRGLSHALASSKGLLPSPPAPLALVPGPAANVGKRI